MFRCLFLCAVWLFAASSPAAEPITLSPETAYIKGWVGAVAFSANSDYLAIGDSSGRTTFWGVSRRYFFASVPHTGPVHTLVFAPDDLRILTGGQDHSVHVIDRGIWTPGK